MSSDVMSMLAQSGIRHDAKLRMQRVNARDVVSHNKARMKDFIAFRCGRPFRRGFLMRLESVRP